MSLRVGDVVKYKTKSGLCSEFVDRWGCGPFIVETVRSASTVTLTTIDGITLTGAYAGDKIWTHCPNLLVIDVFLTHANHAQKETQCQS